MPLNYKRKILFKIIFKYGANFDRQKVKVFAMKGLDVSSEVERMNNNI